MQEPKLKIKLSLWKKLIAELKHRGKGRRESGAFLLSPVGSTVITAFLCYDDLYPDTYRNGIIEFASAGYDQLWDYCQRNKVRVIADVHTHPGDWTQQSKSDQENPMIAIAGHIALIVPCYATKKEQRLNGVGIFEYRGEYKWYDRTRTPNYIKIYKLWHRS